MGYGGKLRGGFWRSMFSQTGGGLGHGDKEDRFVPTPVEMLREKEATMTVAAGSYHTMALGESGTLYLWGKGEYGVLGNGHNTNIPIPNINTFFVTLQQEEQARIKKIGACNFYSGVVMEDGRMFTWGRNDDGQMAIGPGIGMDMYETEKYPAQILGDFEHQKVVDFEPGESISVFLTDTDDVYIAGNKIWWLPSKLLKPEGEKVTSIFAVGKTAGFVTDYKNVYCVGSLFSTKYMEELPKLKIWRVREEVFQGKKIEAIGGAYRNFYAILS